MTLIYTGAGIGALAAAVDVDGREEVVDDEWGGCMSNEYKTSVSIKDAPNRNHTPKTHAINGNVK